MTTDNQQSHHLPKPDDYTPPPPPWQDVRDATHNSRVEIGFGDKQDWKQAPAVYDEHTLKIQGHPVMEDWERPYMKKLAEIATSKNGIVLEVGFGMAIAASYIQAANIEKHIIIEANAEVAQRARDFAEVVKKPVTILEGLWEEVIDQIPDETIDGILFDTYPLSELEIHKNHFGFFRTAYKKLKPGGILTYYSDEIENYSEAHLEKLLQAGFNKENIKGEVVPITPPADCQYWNSDTILAPIIIK